MATGSASHRRYNPLLDEWVLCSPGRLKRPWLGARDRGPTETPPSFDPACYMCPGNARVEGARNPDYRGVFLFDNDYPALTAMTDVSVQVDANPHPLLVAAPEAGRCRVISFSERHDRHLGSMTSTEVEAVVDAWASESERLAADARAAYVQIFENRGIMMGASNPHPHGQIWAVGHVPTIPRRKSERLRSYREDRGGDLLGDYIEEELRRRERIVEETDSWAQVVPFWAVWPFETMLVPKRLVGSLAELTSEERSDLARLLGRTVRRYDEVFAAPFPYSMGWYERPRDCGDHRGFRLHAVFLPPLLRSASVRKFLVGYELTAEPQRDFTAEEGAERLRAIVP
ncbi:MAG TPA: UDP-glucose--hexose-1-phosphate uridylyltransferase [Vicinamibacteria bacterium]|nr:UDP-glucose--hexose-1-phosphate uridylyltransferase [Vicinamibacteria bacterium]